MSLAVKNQRAKTNWLFLRVNCWKQCTCDFFRASNASGKVRLKYLDVLKHQKSYGVCFWGLNNMEKGRTYNFTAYKTVNKVKLIYLEVK